MVQHEGDLQPENAKYESVRLFLRLIPEKHPVKNLLTLLNDSLPVLPPYHAESLVQGAPKPVYSQVSSEARGLFPHIVSARPPGVRSPLPVKKTIFSSFSRVREKEKNEQ